MGYTEIIAHLVDRRTLILSRAVRIAVGALLFSAATAPLPAQAPAAAATQEPVTLHPGDAIRLKVWRMEDMSDEFLIDEAGMATLPLLGPRKVTGIPVPELRRTLYQEYRDYLTTPSIEVTPLRRVYVLGEVKKPGLFSVDPTITLAGAVALAEGPTESGDLNRVRVIRGDQVIHHRASLQATLATVDIRSGDQIFVEQRGWFERNTNFLINLAVSLAFTAVNLALQ